MKDNFKDVLDSLPKVNPMGEAITIVGAVKTVPPADITRATELGLREIGENKVQEFLQKEAEYPPCKLHFIGHLQTNKVKYIIGKVSLIQSCDSEKLAEKISALASASGLTQDVLLEINSNNLLFSRLKRRRFPPRDNRSAHRRKTSRGQP